MSVNFMVACHDPRTPHLLRLGLTMWRPGRSGNLRPTEPRQEIPRRITGLARRSYRAWSVGASLASVYGSAEHKTGRAAGISLAIFDEAFSKMDGKNQRQMMSFYKKLGLQIIIAAPNEKRVAVIEHIDTIVEVDRIGEGSRTNVVQIKEKVREELRAMDPDLMDDAELQSRVAAE